MEHIIRSLFFIVKVFNIHMYILYENGERIVLINTYQKGTYCETQNREHQKYLWNVIMLREISQ